MSRVSDDVDGVETMSLEDLSGWRFERGSTRKMIPNGFGSIEGPDERTIFFDPDWSGAQPVPVAVLANHLRLAGWTVLPPGAAEGVSATRGKPEVVSSIRVEQTEKHSRVAVWNRGGLAGILVVDPNDAREIAERLSAGRAPIGFGVGAGKP